MCGRFVRKTGASEVAEAFDAVSNGLELAIDFNIAPTSDVYVMKAATGRRRLDVVSWGLVPAWSKDALRAASLINARSETVHAKPSFKNLLTRHRCVIPMSAYYEWKPSIRQGKSIKQPYLFLPQANDEYNHDGNFAVAGLWTTWTGSNGESLQTCAALTTEANVYIANVHHRMPVLLNGEGLNQWLDIDTQPKLSELINIPINSTTYHPVSMMVNNARNNGEMLLEPEQVDSEHKDSLF